jgi:hypothetical protein
MATKTLTLKKRDDKVPQDAPEQAGNPFDDTPPTDEAVNPFDDALLVEDAEIVPDADVADQPRNPLHDPAINDVVWFADEPGSETGELRTVYAVERHSGDRARIYYHCDRDRVTPPRTCSLATWREQADLGDVQYANPEVR